MSTSVSELNLAETPGLPSLSTTKPVKAPKIPKFKKTKVFSSGSAIELHPLQEKALLYASFMSKFSGTEQTVDELIQESIGRQLIYLQKHGLEFPPRMLADLTEASLLGK